MERTQMTFYASFWDAIDSLPKKDQLSVFRAVVSYGLCGHHNEVLSSSQKAFFTLMQPVLDSSRKKAESGKCGGSKTKANKKQNISKGEIEGEIEEEYESENNRAADFDRFWQAYPRKVGKVKARAAFLKVTEPASVLLTAIEQQKKLPQWTKERGQYIPYPATWLNGKRWEDQMENAESVPVGRALDADEMAAIQRLLQKEGL